MIGAVQRASAPSDDRWSAPRAACRANCTSSGSAAQPGGYHVEYGYSCMGYEIAGGLGVKMAQPDRERHRHASATAATSMMNSEIATSVMLGAKLDIVVLDNRGFGCINRLQQASGGATLQQSVRGREAACATPRSTSPPMPAPWGASPKGRHHRRARKRRWSAPRPTTAPAVIVIDTDPLDSTPDGGAWWDVPVPEVSTRPQVDDSARPNMKRPSRARTEDSQTNGNRHHERQTRHQPHRLDQ